MRIGDLQGKGGTEWGGGGRDEWNGLMGRCRAKGGRKSGAVDEVRFER